MASTPFSINTGIGVFLSNLFPKLLPIDFALTTSSEYVISFLTSANATLSGYFSALLSRYSKALYIFHPPISTLPVHGVLGSGFSLFPFFLGGLSPFFDSFSSLSVLSFTGGVPFPGLTLGFAWLFFFLTLGCEV